MTKTLTEQWKDGKLQNGYYWCRILDNEEDAFMQHLIAGHFEYSPSFIKEVLSPVPGYDEYKRLQEQLNEAHWIIKLLIKNSTNYYPRIREAKNYLRKYGVDYDKIEERGV